LISRVGSNYPQEWIKSIADFGFDTAGISRKTEEIDARRFYAIKGDQVAIDNPQKYFSDRSLPFPKELLGYSSEQTRLDNRKTASFFTIKPEDVPPDYYNAGFLLICPLDYITHSLIPVFFRAKSGGEVILHPSRSYLNASFYYDFPPIARGAAAVIASERHLLNLFMGRLDDIWEIMEAIVDFGVRFVVVSKQDEGYLLYDSQSRQRLIIPSYCCESVDLVGVESAFCGGFFAGYVSHRDPVRAALMGSVTASIKVQGSTPRYILNALPELARARLDVLQDQVRVC